MNGSILDAKKLRRRKWTVLTGHVVNAKNDMLDLVFLVFGIFSTSISYYS